MAMAQTGEVLLEPPVHAKPLFRLADRELKLELTDTASTYIANRGYDPVFGARPLKRFLQRELDTRIGRKLIAGEILDGHTILVDVVDGALTVEQVKRAETGSEG